MTLTREANEVEVWPIRLQDSLPIIPVPLRTPDPDVPLALSSALRDIYDEAVYDLSIDYCESPPKPSLSEGERLWLEALLATLREEV